MSENGGEKKGKMATKDGTVLEFARKFIDVRQELTRLELFSMALEALIVFLVSLIILKFFGIFWVLGVIPAAFHFALLVYQKRGTDKRTIKAVGRNYPGLKEKLETAYDNKGDGRNLIVEKLLRETSGEVDGLESSDFIDARKTSLRIFAIVACSFIFLFMSALNLSIYNLGFDPFGFLGEVTGIRMDVPAELIPLGRSNPDDLEESNKTNEEEEQRIGGEGGGAFPGFSKGPIPGAGGGAGSEEGSDIIGEKSSAKISGEEITMRIHPEYGGEIDITDDDSTKEFSQDFSLEQAKGAEIPYDEPLEYEEIIRRYFEKLLDEERGEEE